MPTPVVHTRLMRPRLSRMAPADDVEGAAKASPLFAKYGARTSSESAREKLAGKVEAAAEAAEAEQAAKEAPAEPKPKRSRREPKPPKGGGEAIGDFLRSREGRTLSRQVIRGVFGLLKKRRWCFPGGGDGARSRL